MKLTKKLMAIILSLCMLLGAVPAAALAAPEETEKSLNISVMSDLHFYPESMFTDSQEWRDFCYKDSKEYAQSEQLVAAGLNSVALRAAKNGTRYLLIPGDLTKDSEYQAHAELAAMLEKFEKDTGIQVLVTNGNHDINNHKACTFENGTKQEARCITAAEFREVYKNLGFDLADSFYTPADGTTQGMLSYSVDLGDGYRLIVADTNKYDAFNRAKDETGGCVPDGLLNWIRQEAAKAAAAGDEPLLMCHQNIAPHMKVEPSVTFAFCIDDYERIAEALADCGINFSFTGHLHTNDIASVISDDGNAIYDCETPSLTGYPNQYRDIEIVTGADSVTSITYNMVDVDEEVEITIDGVKYNDGEFKNKSFAICYGGSTSDDGYANAEDFFMGIIENFGGGFVKDIAAAGGIRAYLKTLNIDLEKIISDFLSPYIGNGIVLGGYNIFTVENILWFIDDLLGQIEELYIKNPDALWAVVSPAVAEICNLTLTEVPCTKFIDTLRFGDKTRGGTLGDAILSCLYYWDVGNENIYDEDDPDLFMQAAVKQMREGSVITDLFDILVDFAFNDLVDGALLSKLEIRLDKLLGDTKIAKRLGDGLNYLLSYVLRNNFTYKNLVDTVFGLGVLPYTSLFDIVDKKLIKEYLTDSQFESIGYLAAYFVEDFTTDSNPQVFGDFDVTYTSGKVAVPLTRESYRLPTMVSVTMGDDARTSANIGWFSKRTLPETDIEIFKSATKPTAADFKGVATTSSSFTADTQSELVTRYFPGIDIGVAGLFNYEFDMYRHSVRLTGLESGSKYYYRVGNAARGWWSDIGCLETADGSDSVTFFHMSDPQSQNEEQYTRAWANVVSSAFELYPQAKFIVNTGDLVDKGMNVNQWRWMFDTASKDLMSTYHMPVTGNHEEKDEHSTVGNFILPNIPEQDTASGVYYSYEYNNVLVIVLNTNDLNADEALNDAQMEWLKKTAAASDAEWKIVALHKALYSNGSHYDDDDVCAFRGQLGGLLPELDIDLVLQGHDHVYLRTYSLDSNEVTYTEYTYLQHGNDIYKTQIMPTGTTYVISGTSGVKTYLTKGVSLTDEYFPRAQKIYNATTSMFSAIEVEDGVLYFTAYAVDGDNCSVADKFAIQKNTAQGSVVTDYTEDDDPKDDEGNSILSKIIEILKKIFTVALNIYKMYVLGM